MAPQPRERIADPACGSGSLLIKCGHEVGSSDYARYGQERGLMQQLLTGRVRVGV